MLNLSRLFPVCLRTSYCTCVIVGLTRKLDTVLYTSSSSTCLVDGLCYTCKILANGSHVVQKASICVSEEEMRFCNSQDEKRKRKISSFSLFLSECYPFRTALSCLLLDTVVSSSKQRVTKFYGLLVAVQACLLCVCTW